MTLLRFLPKMQISPVELEGVIMKHPEVTEACVIGIPDPDGGDSIPRAYVTTKEGSTLDEDALKEYVRGDYHYGFIFIVHHNDNTIHSHSSSSRVVQAASRRSG